MKGKKWTTAEEVYLKKLAKKETDSYKLGLLLTKKFKRSFTGQAIYVKGRRLGLPITNVHGWSSRKPSQPDKKLIKQLEAEQRRNERLGAKVQETIQRHQTPVNEYFGNRYRYGLVSDTHFGSLWERPDLLQKAYGIMQREGIKDVYHAGDMLEGSGMRKGHEHEVVLVGLDKQVAHCHEKYPEVKGMKTYFIVGSHDLSFFKDSGAHPGPRIADRDDLIQIGQGSYACIPIKVGKTILRLAVEHPRKGTSYALSYQPQKHIDAISGGQKPHLLHIGHYHKAELLPCYRNIITLQAGCFQSQTDWMREGGLAAHLGFWMCEVRATKVGIARYKAEFVPFFEEED